jgi:hypothetical protein
MGEKIRLTGPGSDMVLDALANFIDTVKARKAAAIAEATKAHASADDVVQARQPDTISTGTAKEDESTISPE